VLEDLGGAIGAEADEQHGGLLAPGELELRARELGDGAGGGRGRGQQIVHG
jgi:hypothetical protein